jgi:hypothetical protein
MVRITPIVEIRFIVSKVFSKGRNTSVKIKAVRMMITTWVRVRVTFNVFLTSILDRGVWSASGFATVPHKTCPLL